MKEHHVPLLPTWLEKRAASQLRTVEIAEELGISECELVASACGAQGELSATRLSSSPIELLGSMKTLGRMKTITRNRDAVLEVEGEYADLEMFPHAGQVVGEIDLRVFPRRWRHVFCLREETKRGPRVSLQFFDVAGSAIHKSYVTEETDVEAFEDLVRAHTSPDQTPLEHVEPSTPEAALRPDEEIDVASLRSAWRSMKDTHELFGILRRHGVSRLQALRLVGQDFARPVARGELSHTLKTAATSSVPIMLFVGNPSLIQIWSGPIRRVVPHGPWLNVLDPTVNLHVREDRIDSAWVVRKPTTDGVITALEIFSGEVLTLLIVGKRPHGEAENETWRRIVTDLPTKPEEEAS